MQNRKAKLKACDAHRTSDVSISTTGGCGMARRSMLPRASSHIGRIAAAR